MKSPYLILVSFILLLGCGGGGGSTLPEGPAKVAVTVDPKNIDTGDRTQVTVNISNFKVEGVILKVKFPIALSYVLFSSFIEISGDLIDASPTVTESDTTDTYLVYELSKEELGIGPTTKFSLIFELDGDEDVADGTVGIDADLDVGEAFDITKPQFDAISEADLIVGATPTPTPTT